MELEVLLQRRERKSKTIARMIAPTYVLLTTKSRESGDLAVCAVEMWTIAQMGTVQVNI